MASGASQRRLPAVFHVWLTAKPGGRDENIQLEISEGGVKLLHLNGTAIDSFPFAVISKWLPAELRTQNPGAPECFDLQIQTTNGPKDLRMRASSPDQVEEIVSVLMKTANAVAESSAEEPLGETMSALRSTAPAKLAQLRSPARTMQPPPQTGPYNPLHHFPTASSMPGASSMPTRGGPRSPMGPIRRSGNLGPDADIGTPPSRRRVDIGSLALPRGDGGESAGLGAEARSQLRFLEDMVRRLSEELSRVQMADQPAGATADSATAPPAFLEGVAGNAPLPLWLSDPKYLSPLLVAYDKHLNTQEKTAKQASEKISGLERAILQITAENEKLAEEVANQNRLLSKHAEAQNNALGADNRDTIDRLELLVQENDLLTHQQAELEAEIARLMGRMEERTREHVQAAQDNSHLHAKLRGMQVRLAEAEARAGRFKALAKREEHRAQLAQGPAAAASASDNRQADMGAPAPSVDSSVRQQLREREEDLAASASELSNLRQQLMQVLGSNNALQAQVASLQEQNDAAQGAAAAAQAEAEELRGALANMDSRLTSFHRKDAEVYARIKEAMEQAEQAKLARDASQGREVMLKHENESLRGKLAQLVCQLEERYEAEAEIRESGLRSDLDARTVQVEDLKMQIAELEASFARKERDMESLRQEKAGVLAQLENVPMSDRNLGGGAATLVNMERIKDMQKKVDAAEAAAETAKRELQHATRAATLERQKLQAEVVALIHKQSELESVLAKAQGDLSKAQLEAERARRNELDIRQQRIKADNEFKAALDTVSRERDADMRRLSSRLDDANAMLSKCNIEHSKALEAYEAQVAQWREEAMYLREKMSGIDAEHQQDLTRVRKEKTSGSLDASHQQEAQPSIAEEVRQQVAAMLKTEERLLTERMELRLALDRAQLQRTRAVRAKENAEGKCKLLRNQCDSLQELLFASGAKAAGAADIRHSGQKQQRSRSRGASNRFRQR
eukprot:jgi/Tetstr1/445585/TSEL_033357.t1